MKNIKLLWSIAFGFGIVLFYATVSSLFVQPYSEWYLALPKPSGTPGSTIISIGWAINYILSIVLLTRLIFRHDNIKPIILMIAIGFLQIVWSAVFFTFHSLLIGVIVELLLLVVSLSTLIMLSKNDNVGFVMFSLVMAWYIYTTATGINLLFFNF